MHPQLYKHLKILVHSKQRGVFETVTQWAENAFHTLSHGIEYKNGYIAVGPTRTTALCIVNTHIMHHAAFDVIVQFAFLRLIYQLKLNSVQDTWPSLNSIIKMFHITLSPMLIGWYILNCIELKRPASWLWKGQKVWKFGRSLGKLQRREDKLHKVHFRGGRLFSQWKPYSEELLCWKIYNPSTLKYTVTHITEYVTQCKYSEVWCDCVSLFYETASDSSS